MSSKLYAQDQINQFKNIYCLLISFLENENNSEEDFQKIIKFLDNFEFLKDRLKFQEFLILISQIEQNRHRNTGFLQRIWQILFYLRDEIQKEFSNSDIIKIYKENPNILYLFLQNQMITFTYSDISKETYKFYFFYPEIEKLLDKKENEMIKKMLLSNYGDIFTNFDEKRQKGENESYICTLIRNDSITDFISHVNKTNISLSNTIIKSSIFETNIFLKEKKPTLIEYAAFYGSIRVFNYLLRNKVELKPTIWEYAIHSNSAEIISILEENKIEPGKGILEESIKCHHNEIANYIEENYHSKLHGYDDDDDNVLNNYKILYGFLYSNFNYIPIDAYYNNLAFVFFANYKIHPLLSNIYFDLKNINKDLIIYNPNMPLSRHIIDLSYGEINGEIHRINLKVDNSKLIGGSLFIPSDKKNDFLKQFNYVNIEELLKIQCNALACIKYYCQPFYYSPHSPSLVFSYYEDNLNTYIDKIDYFHKDTANYIIILGLTIALNHIQSLNMIHYYLFPEVIFLDFDFYPHVSGFGISKDSFKNINLKNALIFLPPEVKNYTEIDGFNQFSNVYTYALLISLLLSDSCPYSTMSDLNSSFEKNNCIDTSLIKCYNDFINDFLKTCLSLEPEKRKFSFKQILDIITNEEFYTTFEYLDVNEVKKYLDTFGNEFDYLKSKIHEFKKIYDSDEYDE